MTFWPHTIASLLWLHNKRNVLYLETHAIQKLFCYPFYHIFFALPQVNNCNIWPKIVSTCSLSFNYAPPPHNQSNKGLVPSINEQWTTYHSLKRRKPTGTMMMVTWHVKKKTLTSSVFYLYFLVSYSVFYVKWQCQKVRTLS